MHVDYFITPIAVLKKNLGISSVFVCFTILGCCRKLKTFNLHTFIINGVLKVFSKFTLSRVRIVTRKLINSVTRDLMVLTLIIKISGNKICDKFCLNFFLLMPNPISHRGQRARELFSLKSHIEVIFSRLLRFLELQWL